MVMSIKRVGCYGRIDGLVSLVFSVHYFRMSVYLFPGHVSL